MTRRLSDIEARKIMLSAGAEPLVAFPGTSKPWLSKCLKCLQNPFQPNSPDILQ